MRCALRLHPDSRCTSVDHIDVDIVRTRSHLMVRYVVEGRIDGLRLAPITAPARTDDLWRHTCFEAFLIYARGGGYREFNFSPSHQWAAYQFSDYRADMRPAADMPAPQITSHTTQSVYVFEAHLDLAALAGADAGPDARRDEGPDNVGRPDGLWRLGVSAVIEDTQGAISYWALAHPPGRADFHHVDGFALDLPATDLT